MKAKRGFFVFKVLRNERGRFADCILMKVIEIIFPRSSECIPLPPWQRFEPISAFPGQFGFKRLAGLTLLWRPEAYRANMHERDVLAMFSQRRMLLVLLSAAIASSLLACKARDRYELVAIKGAQPATPPAQASAICDAHGDAAYVSGARENDQINTKYVASPNLYGGMDITRTQTSGGGFWGGFARGMNRKNAGKKAREIATRGCLAKHGYQKMKISPKSAWKTGANRSYSNRKTTEEAKNTSKQSSRRKFPSR